MKILIFLLFSIFSTYAFTSDVLNKRNALNALYDSQKDPVDSTVSGPSAPSKVTESETMSKQANCSDKEQNSLPLRFVLGLLRNKGASLTPSHNVETSTLNIFGGAMIGNCNSMLDYVISSPGEGLPYVFQVKIKECGSEQCEYNVKKIADNGEEESQIKVEPSFTGFIQCLEQTGVFKDGKVQNDKVVTSEFMAEKKGVDKTSQLWFASHGPWVDPKGGVYSKNGNKKVGEGCFYFEDIQKGGFQLYSKDDVLKNEKKAQFNNLCSAKNYKLIDSKLSDFKQLKNLQLGLEKVRNDLLLKEVVKQAKNLKQDDLSNMDTEKMNDIMEDFYRYVISPKKEEINQVYKDFVQASGEEKRKLQKKLNALVKDFKKYAKSPYFNRKDIERMQSFKKQAPIDSENWANALLTLNKTINTISAYQIYKGKKKKRSPLLVQKDIDRAQGSFARELAQLRRLAEDPDYSKAKELRDHRNLVLNSSRNNVKKLRRAILDEEEFMMKDCCYIRRMRTFNQACVSKKYYKNVRRCVEDSEYYIKKLTLRVKALNERNKKIASKLDSDAKDWDKVEYRRNKYRPSEEDDDDLDSEVTENSYDFNIGAPDRNTKPMPSGNNFRNLAAPFMNQFGQMMMQRQYGRTNGMYQGGYSQMPNFNLNGYNANRGPSSFGGMNGGMYPGYSQMPGAYQYGMTPAFGYGMGGVGMGPGGFMGGQQGGYSFGF